MRYINKRSLLLIITILLVCTLGISYAAFRYYETGKQQQLLTGEIYLKFKDNTSSLSLSNIYPETKEEARSRTDNVITFTIDGTSTVSNKDVYYEIYLNEGDEKAGMTRFNPKDIVFDLIEIDESGNRTTVVDAKSFSDFNKKRIWVNTVNRNSTINKTYELRMWLSEDVIISDTEDNASYTTSDFENRYLSIKVGVYGDFVEKELVPKLIEKIENTLPLTEADVDGTRFVYGETVDNNYVWYSGKLWRIVGINSDGSIKLVTQGNMTTIAWDTSDTNNDYSTSQIRTWLNNEFLPTLHNSENLLVDYEWDYTAYESFPITKLETTASVTEKVGLLNIYEIMKTSSTGASGVSNNDLHYSVIPLALEDDVVEHSISSFLNNNTIWWTMSQSTGDSSVWHFSYYGSTSGDGPTISYDGGPTTSYGVRPSVNLVSNIQIDGGSGTESDPYRIKGDKTTGQANELLNNRVSGEYINFNNTKYRIVGKENGLTKITMADYDVNGNTLSTLVAFGAGTSELTFSTAYGIGKYLNDWYNATSESDTSGTYTGLYLDETYKSMIATPDDGVRWYAGPDSGGTSYDYTKATQGTGIEATVGLGRYGEMFSSQLDDELYTSSVTWLITKYSSLSVWVVSSNYANDSGPIKRYGARPSFYLKSDVKITGGTGMPHDPYEIVYDAPTATSAPVCKFASDYYEWSASAGDVEVILECTSESGFTDHEITGDDFIIGDGESYDYINVFEAPVISAIDNGYRYTLKVLDDFVVILDNYIFTLKSNSVINSTGGNSETSTNIYFQTDWH